MGNNEEPRLEPLGIFVGVCARPRVCVCVASCPYQSLNNPIEGSKQSYTENSTDYTNDDYGDNDCPAISMVITVGWIF